MGREAKAMLLERWQRYWSWLFYGLLLVATAFAVADGYSDGLRGAIVMLVLAIGVWYRQAVAGSGGFAQGGGLQVLVTWKPGKLSGHWSYRCARGSRTRPVLRPVASRSATTRAGWRRAAAARPEPR